MAPPGGEAGPGLGPLGPGGPLGLGQGPGQGPGQGIYPHFQFTNQQMGRGQVNFIFQQNPSKTNDK